MYYEHPGSTRAIYGISWRLERRDILLVATVRPADLKGCLAELDRRGLQGSTRNRKTHTLKSFFTWLIRQGLLADDLSVHIVPPKPNKQEPRYVSEPEYRRLLHACSHYTRDATIVELFPQTGLRLSDLARLVLGDVELPKRIMCAINSIGSVRVQHKGGKVERIPLNAKACQALATYWKAHHGVDHGGLFVTTFKT